MAEGCLTMDDFPTITSFVIRFVLEATLSTEAQPTYRGFIRHVQTDSELAFTRWEDAMAFMRQFVPSSLGMEETAE
jgi:hypothetical protein